MGIVFKFINIFLSIIFFIIAVGIAYVAIPYFGNQALIVRSGSMSPAFEAGSVIVVRENEEIINPQTNVIPRYGEGEIIAFRSENNPNILITHRIISTEIKDGNIFYKTKGDANKTIDGWVVKEENILGKTYFVLPNVGSILAFAKSDTGFPLLIIAPALLVVILEVFNIIREIRKNIKRSANNHNFSVIKTIVPFLILGLTIPSAFAFSQDAEKSTNNIFQASEIFPNSNPTEPEQDPILGIANHLVISEVQIDGGNAQDNNNDFIEIYNPTSDPINLGGFRLVKRSGGSGNDDNIFTFSSSHIIPAHGYFLWGHKSGGQNPNNFADEIGADVSSSDTLGASNSIAIRLGPLDTGVVIDALSWDPGASSLKEGVQFPENPQENESLERLALSSSTSTSMDIGGADEFKGNGFDSDNNAIDFIIKTLPEPQNSTSSAEMP